MTEKIIDILGISDKRDEELRTFTLNLITRTRDMSEFLFELEKDVNISSIEKLYIAAQYGRIQAMYGKKDKCEDIPYIG